MREQRVKFGVRFMDYKKGDTATLPKDVADRYTDKLGVCARVKPRPKKKAAGAPSDKKAAAPVDK